MDRLLMAVALWVGMAQAGVALTVEERLVAGLQDQGYTVLEQGYTFLGRLRIVAETDLIHREIVVNPGTGEILRDYAVYISDMPQAAPNAQLAEHDTKSDTTNHADLPPQTTVAGTADVAASTLTPGTATLATSSLSVEATKQGGVLLLDATILPMTSGIP